MGQKVDKPVAAAFPAAETVARGAADAAAPGSGRRPSLPAGAAAYVFEEAARRRGAEERIVERLRAAGFLEAMLPSADYLAPYAPHLQPHEERELYRFVDRHGDALALRADFTIALARHLSARLPSGDRETRVFYRGEVLRGGGTDGATGEFYQIGAELLGVAGPRVDAEMAQRCVDAVAAGGSEDCHVILSAVGAIERMLLPELAGDQVAALAALIRGRRLAEADAAARSVSPEFASRVRHLLEGGLDPQDPRLDCLGETGESLREAMNSLARNPKCRVAIDLAEPAARSYYTGFFFAVYGPSGGEPIAGGGRYDRLYASFGSPRPAVGFSLGLEGVIGL
ncbi:MAG TPA: ATP phosphoribosyltransferase regulatory subunit [Thermoanaerobaculia bacterium]